MPLRRLREGQFSSQTQVILDLSVIQTNPQVLQFLTETKRVAQEKQALLQVVIIVPADYNPLNTFQQRVSASRSGELHPMTDKIIRLLQPDYIGKARPYLGRNATFALANFAETEVQLLKTLAKHEYEIQACEALFDKVRAITHVDKARFTLEETRNLSQVLQAKSDREAARQFRELADKLVLEPYTANLHSVDTECLAALSTFNPAEIPIHPLTEVLFLDEIREILAAVNIDDCQFVFIGSKPAGLLNGDNIFADIEELLFHREWLLPEGPR